MAGHQVRPGVPLPSARAGDHEKGARAGDALGGLRPRLVADQASLHLNLVPDFSPGLEGVVAAETEISEVDGANGRLIYRGGYLIEDLAPVVTFEEVAYLLWHGELPNEKELEALRRQMAAARKLNASARGTLAA